MTDTPNNGTSSSLFSELEITFVEEETPLPLSHKPPQQSCTPSSKLEEEVQILISDEESKTKKETQKQVELVSINPEQPQESSSDSNYWDEDSDQLDFLEACKTENLEMIESLLSKAPSVLELMTTKIKGDYAIHVILERAADQVLKLLFQKQKYIGQWLHLHSTPCLNLALKTMLLPKLRSKALACFMELLTRSPTLVKERDRLGRSAFHWACIAGSEEAVQALLKVEMKATEEQARSLILSDLDDKQPVHYAIERGHAGVLALLLNQLGSELLVESDNKETLIERAIHCSSWKCLLTILSVGGTELLTIPNSKGELPVVAAQRANNEKEFNALISAFQSAKDKDLDSIVEAAVQQNKPTLLITSNFCNLHRASEQRFRGYPEKPERLQSLYNEQSTGVLQGLDFANLKLQPEAGSVKIADVLRVHEYSYVEKLEEIVEMLKKRDEGKEAGRPPSTFHLDSDTYMNQFTLDSAKRAAGSVIEAIEAVLQGKVRNAFVAVRPPGHHCGPFGAVRQVTYYQSSPLSPEATSNGFCFYNSAAIGAAYVRCLSRGEVSRIAIVDFDVHHGNGTQECVLKLKPTKMRMRVDLPFTKGALDYSCYKPWQVFLDCRLDEQDSKNVLFISSHGYDTEGHDFYPMSGVECTPEDDPDYPGGIMNIPFEKYATSAQIREMYSREVLPRLAQFKPDFIILSAGFDAHEEDEVNDSFGQWNEHDYGWMTEQLIKIANTYSRGRLVSILEGGYCIRGGHLSPFAESVATHVRELRRPNSGLFTTLSEEEMNQVQKTEEQKMLRKREMRVERRFSLRKRKVQTDQSPLEGRMEQQTAELENGIQGKSPVGEEKQAAAAGES